jgi:hypothetical protein
MKKICYFIVLLPFCLSAQNNESDTLKWKASLDLTGIYQEGNVETAIFRAKAKVEYRPWKKWLFKTQNSYVYQEFGKQKADEDILSLNFLYFNPERRVYPQLLGFASTNFRRRIDLRYLLGAGVTFKILDQEKYALKVSLSSEYEQTDFRTDIFNREAYNGNSSIHTFRSTIWINGRYQLFDKKVVLSHESYFQPSLEQGDNYRWRADLGLELPVWKFLNFKINYLHFFESIVAESQVEEDRILTFGLTVKSY